MKKISLLIMMLLVLMSSIVFSACNNGYKKLKIECNVEEINLVLDDDELSNDEIVFNLSGAKSWGKISIVSEPAGLVHTAYEIKDKQCGVLVQALQPSGDGASLIIKHLGSGKSCKVPLKIGRKLQSLTSANADFVINMPTFEAEPDGDIKPVEMSIPTNQLLNLSPLNYSDNILWQFKSTAPKGVNLNSYNANNDIVSTFERDEADGDKELGTSSAVKTLISLSNECGVGEFVIRPISVLDGKAILYTNVEVTVHIIDLLEAKDIKVTSSTHGNADGDLKNLVLISNPDPKNPRIDSVEYDYYSTALIDLKTIVDDDLLSIYEANEKYLDLYTLELSSNIDGLQLEDVGYGNGNENFGKIRVIASSTCVGSGEINIKFVPKACVGDIKQFVVTIPCLVGERATSFKASNNGVAIEIERSAKTGVDFEAITPLRDASADSLGQMFRFEMLSANTLDALSVYKIIIDAKLLDIDESRVTTEPDGKRFINNIKYLESDKVDPNESRVDLTVFLGEDLLEKYRYQIAIKKDGRDITFYYDKDAGTLTSEPLFAHNTIYMKWADNGNEFASSTDFGVQISNFYNEEYKYDIQNHGFDKTCIKFNLEFDRQRTIESIEYLPIKVTTGTGINSVLGNDAGEDWQFYFEPNALDEENTYYGFQIIDIRGIDGVTLTQAELDNIYITIKTDTSSLGFAVFDVSSKGPEDAFVNEYAAYKHKKDAAYDQFPNIVLIGKIAGQNISCGDYEIKISQTFSEGNKSISLRNLKIYENLQPSNVSINIPSADFDGKYLQYEKLDDKPANWDEDYTSYYEYSAGDYIPVTNATWDKDDKDNIYYKKIDLKINNKGTLEDLDLSNTYILATDKSYIVDIDIANNDFANIKSKDVKSIEIVSNSGTIINGYITNNTLGVNNSGEHVIRTNSVGSYNTQTGTGEKNYLKITYTVSAYKYDYYKLSDEGEILVDKEVYLYIYEPLTSATLNKTMLYKYNIAGGDNREYIRNEALRNQEGMETLHVNLNNNKVFNYIDVKWHWGGLTAPTNMSKNSATYSFDVAIPGQVLTGTIGATLVQFGVQYPIYCGYNVREPIISERVILDNKINNFKSGDPYINLKENEEIELNVRSTSPKGPVTIQEFDYFICDSNGYEIGGIAEVKDGKLKALKAGSVKLVIVASDVLTKHPTNCFRTSAYVYNDAYLIIDVLVSDGSEAYPYLIATADDFKAIKDDNTKHYALVNDIILNGISLDIGTFSGTISSYQQDENSNNRFNVYGVMLDKAHPNLFTELSTGATLKNINFQVNINYIETERDKIIYIGLVGTNNGTIENISVTISGNINCGNVKNTYTIGGMVAKNNAEITIDATNIVGVEGNIVVSNTTAVGCAVQLGGLVGENYGSIEGANPNSSEEPDGKVEYDVFYGNQGATADVVLQVKGVNNQNSSAIGGVVGYNNGTMKNVYSTGKVLGTDDSNALVVSNVGGLIGKNSGKIMNGDSPEYRYAINVDVASKEGAGAYATDLDYITINDNMEKFQIVNSYSSAQVFGKENVGGAIGYDEYGSYYKVYYEMYYAQTNVQGNSNIGGLIGKAQDSTLQYCYANSFAWDYSDSVDTYDIVGTTNVGGLIGSANSSRKDYFTENDAGDAMNIIQSLASLSISAPSEAGGLVGYMQGHGAIYNAYFYGVINSSTIHDITKPIKDYGNNTPYSNVYSIVNGQEKTNQIYTTNVGDININAGVLDVFAVNPDYNNGKPYIIYNVTGDPNDKTNLVSVIPTVIEINKAFSDDYYTANNTDLYRRNDEFGEYVRVGDDVVAYNQALHEGRTRYSLVASRIVTGDTTGDNSNYRIHALVLYYYQFKDMTGENALSDLYYLNTIDMHKIIADDGIEVLPDTLKRFNLRSSDNEIVSILNNGRLLLNAEGQATITLISALNPSVTASFVVIVRTKVQEFGLYSSANLRDEYSIAGKTINIVKDSSKLLYADYSSTIKVSGRRYEYIPATNMKIKFTITYVPKDGETLDGDISNYISLNGTDLGGGNYIIDYGMPITVTVKEYALGQFEITATPYIVATYENGAYNHNAEIALEYYATKFNVATKQGPTAINTDHTQLDMMSADEQANVNVKINTDMEVDALAIEISSVGEVYEVENINNAYTGNANATIKFVEMLDMYVNGTAITFEGQDERTASIENFGGYVDAEKLQTLSLGLKLNKMSHYVNVPFRLQIKLTLANGINTIFHIDVKPQEVTSLTALNYRIEDGEKEVKFDNAYLSQVIRPGSTNIITIDLAPNIAIYDSVEIKDLTTEDKILFQQVDQDLKLLENMDTWVDNGIKLQKYDFDTSKLYTLAKLPLYSQYNITHTIQIIVYDKDGNILKTNYLYLEAVMYPRVVMTYTYPNGEVVTADTADGNPQEGVKESANLAVGVEAGIDIKTYNIDQGTLQGHIVIMDASGNEIPNNGLVSLNYEYEKYMLRFNVSEKDNWEDLVGKSINVIFTASKQLNGIVETCKATIQFNIRRIVIHGVSMTREGSSGKLYGNWDEEFSTQLYFDKTDISYYSNNGYWNIQYTLANTYYQDIVDTQIRRDTQIIHELLDDLNNLRGAMDILLDEASIRDGYNTGDINLRDNINIKNISNSYVIKAGKNSGINNKNLVVEFKIDYDNLNYPELNANGTKLSNKFGFDVADKSTPFDEYLTVSSQEEFEDMQIGRYYRLTRDLTFTNYTPIDTAIGGFSGDGYTITIIHDTNNSSKKGFNEAQLIQNYISGGMYIGIFGTLAEDSVVQNLQVKYEVNLDLNNSQTIQEQHTNNIYFGGIAGINLGVITNVKVSGSFTLTSQYISAENIDLGGISAINGSSAGAKVATITSSTSELQMSSMALIGGVSGTNYGKIANTGFKGSIASSASNEYASNIFTAGFVVENMPSGYISLSYVEPTKYVNPTMVAGGYNIFSVGRTGGFVFNNAGTISNSYVNQTAIRSQGNIGGFVYQSAGSITNCYSYPTLGNSLFYEEFMYSTANSGKVTNCYVVTDNNKQITIKGLKSIRVNDVSIQENYLGFAFAKREQGIWYISQTGPILPHAGFNDNRTTYNDIYNIYDVETFEGYFNTKTNVIEGKTFRIVRDIDFANSIVEGNPITFNKTLRASVEGNDMEISNYNIFKQGSADSIGLFANIANAGLGTYLRNLILKPESIKASGSCAVGALAGVIDGANIYNVVIDNSSILALGKNAVGGLAGIIKGDFEVMGITSNISAFASYTHNSSSQYNLYTGKNVTNSALLDNLATVSYAGSVAGIVNGYNNSTFTASARNINDYHTISDITLNADIVVIAETVGGAFGLIGEKTLVRNINYNLSGEARYQGVYVSGGLVGENRGVIQKSNIYAYDETDGNKKQVDTSACFDGQAKVNGGIVGVNIGGLIHECSSDINICTTKDRAIVGGIVGRNVAGYVYNSVVSSDLNGFVVGGIIGSDYGYNTIIKQESGSGIATAETKRAYNNIKSKVNYVANYIDDFNNNTPFKANSITDKFVNNFIKRKGDYYTFNTAYFTENENNIVDASKVFGFVLGVTDADYRVELNNTVVIDGNIKNIGKMRIDIKTATEAHTSYEVKYNGYTKDIVCISNIVVDGVEYPKYPQAADTEILYFYIIAHEETQYDSWSAISGYKGNEYIVFTPEGLI